MRVHDLLRITDPSRNLTACEGPEATGGPLPDWAGRALRRTPWVVVRRAAPAPDGRVAVGVRGATRAERLAAWVDPAAVEQRLAPEDLPSRVDRLGAHRSTALPALRALPAAAALLAPFGLPWGPGGSVGFELASGAPTTTPGSDLDLVLRAEHPLAPGTARRLVRLLHGLPVRADALLETGHGAVALGEYARGEGPVLLRTPAGPVLTRCPWNPSLPSPA
ncbi:malonate decarboxylase holo-ACP synthase [Streptomyces sp. NPDC059740]|uniref:malonate decarboxylase holo-ACP synthase n=1 Tax=Streptomyces sp. NPDC059740 TaxID=3346926 RepID=UPI0036518CDF